MIKFFWLFCFLLTSFASIINPPQLLAQTTPKTSKVVPKNLKTTDQIVEQVCNFLKAQKSFTVDMDVTYDDLLESGGKIQYSAYQKLSVQKPNYFRSDYVGDERVTNFYYDGKNLSLYAPSRNYYAIKAAPNTIDAVLNQIDEKYGITIPMSNLFASDPCADMLANVTQTIFAGIDMVNRQPTYHILMLGQDRDFQIWVTQDKQPLLKKALITYKNLPESPQYTAIFSNWNFNPKISPNSFVFKPPKNANKIEVLPADALQQTSTEPIQLPSQPEKP